MSWVGWLQSSLSHSDRHSEVIADHATRVRFASMIGPLCDQSFGSRDYLNQLTLVIFSCLEFVIYIAI